LRSFGTTEKQPSRPSTHRIDLHSVTGHLAADRDCDGAQGEEDDRAGDLGPDGLADLARDEGHDGVLERARWLAQVERCSGEGERVEATRCVSMNLSCERRGGGGEHAARCPGRLARARTLRSSAEPAGPMRSLSERRGRRASAKQARRGGRPPACSQLGLGPFSGPPATKLKGRAHASNELESSRFSELSKLKQARCR